MATVTKTIGYVPVFRGGYIPGTAYGQFNIVTLYGCAFVSLGADNTTPPATLDAQNNIVLNSEKWAWLVDNSAGYRYNETKQDKTDPTLETSSKSVVAAINELAGLDTRLKRDLGYNATQSAVTLQPGLTGKYIKCSTRSAASNAGFAISQPFDVEACSELLIKTGYNPSDTTHAPLDISVIAIYEELERQRTVQKKDASGNPLYYAVETDEDGNEHVTEAETTVDTGHPVNVVETYTEVRYLPNNEDRFVSIPDSGYYVANIPQSCRVVISYKPGITDMDVLVVKHGALANLGSQLFGIYEHRTMVEAVASLAARLDALESGRGLLGNATAGTLDVSQITRCNAPVVLLAHGVPAADAAPDNWPQGLPWDGVPYFRGEIYINLDAASGGVYYAKGNNAVSDWAQA